MRLQIKALLMQGLNKRQVSLFLQKLFVLQMNVNLLLEKAQVFYFLSAWKKYG